MAVTVVAGFAGGFALARSGTTTSTETAATVTTTTEPPAPTDTPQTTSTTAAPTTTAPVATTATTSTTAAPPTTAAPVPSTVPSTTVVAPPTTVLRPAELTVQFAADGAGRLVLPVGGSASVTIRNNGGSSGQWLLSGTGFASSNGVTRGQLAPGEQAVATLGPAPGQAVGTTGTLSVLGAGPGGTTVIATIVG